MELERWLAIRGVLCFDGRFLGRSSKTPGLEVALGYLSMESRDVSFLSIYAQVVRWQGCITSDGLRITSFDWIISSLGPISSI